MCKLTCEPRVLIAAFVLLVVLTEAAEMNPVLVLGAVCGALYLALLARRGLRSLMRGKRTAGEQP